MRSAFFACLWMFLAVSQLEAAEPSGDWPRFRGPEGTGVVVGQGLPTHIAAGQVQWSVDLPVRGHSSPILYGDQIFLTGSSGGADGVRRHLFAVDRKSGKVQWNEVVATGEGEKLHKMNSWATPSCASDGERVVAFFGDGGLHCFSVDGKPMWSRDLGKFPGAWGVGASPIFYGDTIIQNCDAEGDSALIAVNKETGKAVWQTPRKPKPKGGWSTPILIQTKSREELVVNGEYGVQSYDPASGKPFWSCTSFNGRGTPVPAWDGEQLYVVNGKTGDVYCVKPTGTGDVTQTHMTWHTARRGGRDLPSPVICGDVLFVVSMGGIATGYDTKTGAELWKERLGGNYSGSPIVAGEYVYIVSEEGDLSVLRPAKKLQRVSKLSLQTGEEIFRSSIGVSDGQLFVRSDKRLYCIGE